MDKIEERDLGEELYDLYKVVEFPCSDEEERSARERIVEIEKTLDINHRKLV
ncbi:hypothetical protein ACROAH_15465 [Shewanella oncorhynchi]|uniref:hypothetical protein n=1 Tax=Shewanella TaxID=22 RepID=UPI0039B0E657